MFKVCKQDGEKYWQVKGDQECQGAGCNFKLNDLGRDQ